MNLALKEFEDSILLVRQQTPIYDYLVNTLHLPTGYSSEILRSQLVCAVSAMDRFFHEVVRIGFIETFNGIRLKTPKYNSWQFSNETMLLVIKYSDPGFVPSSGSETPQFLIEQDVISKLSILAFQHPDKIKEALSYVWLEDHKMQTIAQEMGFTGKDINKQLEQRLKLICERRNQIVHEGDIEPVSRQRRGIIQNDVNDMVDFIDHFCHAVYTLITKPGCYVSSPSTP